MGWIESRRTLLPARVFILELGKIVDILVNDDPEVVCLVVGGHIGRREALRHDVLVRGERGLRGGVMEREWLRGVQQEDK
jgi:hypothetical protein